MGVAFNNVRSEDGYYPAISIYRGTRCLLNFGRDFTYKPIGAYGLNPKINGDEEESLMRIFQKYRESGLSLSSSQDTGDNIVGNGILQLGVDLGSTSDEDPLLLIIAWKLSSASVWEFYKSEWLLAWALNGCFTLDQMKAACVKWREDIATNASEYRSFYTFVFGYLKDDKATAIDREEAIMAWRTVGIPDRWTLWDKWLQYLQENNIRSVNKDTWLMLLRFIEQVGNDVSSYDSFDCWPLIIDEYVDFLKK